MTLSHTSDSKIVLHIGAHKTASTHLQNCLRDVAPVLRSEGVRYFGPDALRKKGQSLPERFGFPFDPKNARPDADPKAELTEMLGDGTRLVLSEENFAGNFQRGWGKVPLPVYPKAADRVARLADAMGHEIDLCLAIRQPSDFLASIYSQILLSGKTVSPDEFLIRNMPSNVDWSDYIGQLRNAVGVSSVTVWRYEDYGRLFPAICANLVGESQSETVKQVSGRAMPRLSEAAVGAALSQRLLKTSKKAVRDLAADFPTTDENPPFELFDSDLRSIASEYYNEQVAAIAEMSGVTLLQ